MVQLVSNQSVYRISDVFGYLDELFGKFPGPAVKFAQVPESLAHVNLGAKAKSAIADSLVHVAQNGRKYSGTGADIWISATEANNSIVFQVANEGRTMPFWQRLTYGKIPGMRRAGSEAIRGRGMGSVLARENIESVGGRLAVSAKSGGGTIVRMTVPISVEKTSTSWWTSAARFFNSEKFVAPLNTVTKTTAKGLTFFLLALDAVPAVAETTYNFFDDPCDVYARDVWFNWANNYLSEAGIFGDMPNVPWYQRVGYSMQWSLNFIMPSALTKFSAAIDPFDDGAKNWMAAKANACRSGAQE